jgi:hypothetical protein
VFVPTPPPAVVPATPTAIVLLLDAARRERAEGDLETAARLLTDAISLPKADPSDRAWARLELALLHADPSSALHSDEDAEFHLNELVKEAPETQAAAIGAVLLRVIDQARIATRNGKAAMESAEETSQALAAVRSALARREQELERIKAILLGETPP